MNDKRKLLTPALLLLAFALTRWPGVMPLNFSAAYALAFCAGAFQRRLTWWMPLAVMLGTDAILNVFFYDTAIFSDYQAVNYLAYALIFLVGKRFGERASVLKLVCGGLLGAIIFYLVTNTAAWLQNHEYAKTFAGWITALTTGVPGWPPTWTFFFKTFLSGGIFTGIIAAAIKASPREAPEPEPAEADEPIEQPDEGAKEDEPARPPSGA